jgi:hypothetical protein
MLMNPNKRQARFAGLLYLLMAVTAPIGLIYVPNKLIVVGDATSTADHIRSSELLFRIGIASELFHQVVEVFLVLALYALFKSVSKAPARQMAILGLIPIPIVFLNVLNEIAAITLVDDANLSSILGKPQLDAFAMLAVRLHGQGIQVASVFWGLWLFPFGVLVWRSGFIPKVLGVFLIFAGFGYVFGSLTALVIPQYTSLLANVIDILQMGELPIILWLVIWGARSLPPETTLSQRAT